MFYFETEFLVCIGMVLIDFCGTKLSDNSCNERLVSLVLLYCQCYHLLYKTYSNDKNSHFE